MELRLKVTLATDAGLQREHNEDAAAIDGHTVQHDHGEPITRELVVATPVRVVVCDGMGGHRGGRAASMLTATQLSRPGAGYEAEFQRVSELLISLGLQEPSLYQMGTTAVLLEARPDGSASVLHVGDSRAYLADPELARLTLDDRVSAERSVLTQALGGCPATLRVHRYDFNLYRRQRVLLCSDGLVDMATDEQIEQLIHGADAARDLVELAIQAGAYDNVTVAVIEVLDSPRERG